MELLGRMTKPTVFCTDALWWEGPSPPPPLVSAHLLKLANGGRAAGGVLAHAHGGVVLIQLTHLAVFAVVVLAGVWQSARACS